MSAPEDAREAGVVFYDLPADLSSDQIDPLMRPIVEQINKSGFCWTAESCQGHPDATEHPPWAGNTEPMLRLVCRREDMGRVLSTLVDAAEIVPAEEFEADYGYSSAQAIRIFPHTNPKPRTLGWAELLVYLPAACVWSRNRGIRVLQRFADLLGDDHQT